MSAASTAKYIAYGVAIVAGAAVVYLIVQKGKSLGGAVASVANAVNPLSPDNVAYRAASSVASVLSGDDGMSSIPLGTRLWEWMNPAAVARERALLAPGTPDKAGRFFITHDDDGNLIGTRSAPVPSAPAYQWGPSVMGEMMAP